MNILIHWNEEYSVKNKELDQQHKKLIDMLNQAYDSLFRDEKDDILEQIITDMKDYAFIHFKNEEKYFAQSGYEDAPAHIAEHQFFLKNVEKFCAEYKAHDAALRNEIMIFLQDWLIKHIMWSDKKYMESFIKAGIK